MVGTRSKSECTNGSAEREKLTFNKEKSKLRREVIQLLGYEIKQCKVRPDSLQLQPLLDMPPPSTPKELKRICGMFAYYAMWIQNFSDKAGPLLKADAFPLNEEALTSFNLLKQDLASASLTCIQEEVPFEIESDASDYAIATILSQNGKPVAFMSRTLNTSKRNYPIVEKEATAIIEAVRKWAHLLKGKTFTLITDQKSVSFMFDKTIRGKVKNNKIMLWRLELGQYHYEIRHKPGKDNVVPDAFSKIPVCASQLTHNQLVLLHESLGHSGYVRLFHFVRSRNLPYTGEDVKSVCRNCQVCAEIKPRFYRPEKATLVKASKPWERLAIDFKSPVKGPRPYLLVIIDE